MTDVGTDRITVSYSELSTFRQCPLLHMVKYQQRWTKPVTPGGALDKGKLWHAVQEIHWKIIFEWNATHPANKRRTDAQDKTLLAKIRKAIAPLLYDQESGAQTEVQELIEWMYKGWLELYGTDRDSFKPLAIEHPIEVPLKDERGMPTRFVLKARIDLIGRDLGSGLLVVVDHKSGGNLPDDLALELDDQFGLYLWLLRMAGKNAAASWHWGARTQRNQADHPGYEGRSKPQTLEQRFRRTLLTREDIELKNIALDAYHAANAAYPLDPDNAPRYSAPNPRSCSWMCDIKAAHLMARKGRRLDEALFEHGFHVDRTRH